MTVPVFNAAKKIVFLVAGEEKADVVKDVIEDRGDFPAARIRPKDGELIFLLDKPAASRLPAA